MVSYHYYFQKILYVIPSVLASFLLLYCHDFDYVLTMNVFFLLLTLSTKAKYFLSVYSFLSKNNIHLSSKFCAKTAVTSQDLAR